MNQQTTAATSIENSIGVVDVEMPAFLDDGPSDIIPPFITTTNARELFDMQPGETVAQAAARKALEDGLCR